MHTPYPDGSSTMLAAPQHESAHPSRTAHLHVMRGRSSARPHRSRARCEAFAAFVTVILCAAAMASCDFPSDPPLKPLIPAQPETYSIDSAHVLLPLTHGNMWSFLVASSVGPSQMASVSRAQTLDYQGQHFALLRYYYVVGGGPFTSAFPPVLQNHTDGLHLFERGNPMDTVTLSREPKLAYVLPYPSMPGVRWSSPASEYSVLVTARDTLVQGFNDFSQHRCYRYDVEYRGRLKTVLFVKPGIAFIRIDTDNLAFFTTAWQVK